MGARRRRARTPLLTALLLGLLLTSAPGDEEGGERTEVPIHALLIGCARYPALQERSRRREPGVPNPRLRGPERDVELMRETLLDLGVEDGNVRVLSTDPRTPASMQPTRENILRELAGLPDRVRRVGDAQVLVLYAGHGTQQWDTSGEWDEVDGMDEAWCPMDTDLVEEGGLRAWKNVLLDDEIGALLGDVTDAGALVWLVMDCCHAGTGVRGGVLEGASRGLPAPPPPPSIPVATVRSAGGAPEDEPFHGGELHDIVAFYGSRSFQKLHEVRVRGESGRLEWRGPLSVAVVRGLTGAGDRLPDLTYSELFDAVRLAYSDLGRLGTADPQTEGDLARRVFRKGSVRSPRLRLLRRPDGRLALTSGAILGVREGSEVTVYERGGRGRADKRVGTVVVRQVLGNESICEPAPGSDAAWAAQEDGGAQRWDAVLTGPIVGPGRMRLAVAGTATLAPGFRDLFADVDEARADFRSRFRLVDRPEEADWLLLTAGDGVPRALRRRGGAVDPQRLGPLSGRLPRAEDLERRLWRLYRAQTVLDLHDGGVLPRLPAEKPVLQLEVREVVPEKPDRIAESGATLSPGSTVRLELVVHAAPTQEAGRQDAYDAYVFWLTADHEFIKLFPHGQQTTEITREQTRRIPLRCGPNEPADTLLADNPAGTETLLLFARPRAGVHGSHLDLDFLAGEPVTERGVERKGLVVRSVRQLRDLAFGLRARGEERWEDEEGVEETLSLDAFRWETAWGPLRVPPVSADAPAVLIESPLGAGDPPDVRELGGEVRLARAGRGVHEALCVLVAEDAGAVHALVDLDGSPESPRTPSAEDLARLVREKTFDAELAYRLEPDGRRIVWYDGDDDGVMDLVLVDTDGDRRADRAYRGAGRDAVFDPDADLALLCTSHLHQLWTGGEVSDLRRVLSRLRSLTSEP